MQLVGVGVLPVQVLAHGLGGELRLADVAEIPRQVDRFTWGKGGGGETSVVIAEQTARRFLIPFALIRL